MAWFLRLTEFGPEAVYGQMGSNACGIACVMMINFKMKKLKALLGQTSIADAVKSEQDVYKAYSKVIGSPYDGTKDSNADKLPYILNELDLGTWQAGWVGTTDVGSRVATLMGGKSDPPIILLVNWGMDMKGGGHFVVCDAVVKSAQSTKAVLCDPWDASARGVTLQANQNLIYQPAQIPGQVDFGQSRHHYKGSEPGIMNGWVIWQARP